MKMILDLNDLDADVAIMFGKRLNGLFEEDT